MLTFADASAVLEDQAMVAPLAVRDAAAAMQELTARFALHAEVRDAAELARALEQREAQASTFLGHGLALPHARTRAASRMVIAAGVNPAGIPWGPKGEPARLVVAVAVPAAEVRGYLELVRRLSRAVRQTGWIDRVAAASGPSELGPLLRTALTSV